MVSGKAKEGQSPRKRTVSFAYDPEYWGALGRFVETFAGTETVLFNYFSASLHMQHSITKAVFTGIRADQMIEIIRRVWQVDPAPVHTKKEVDDVLKQLKRINTARNRLVHHQSFLTTDKGRVSSNITRAYTKARVDDPSISVEVLQDMIADLEKAGHHLATLLIQPYIPLPERAADIPALADAWRYKVQLFRNQTSSQKRGNQDQKHKQEND